MIEPYESVWEHLREELDWLDATLEVAVHQFVRPKRPVELEQFGGLILGHAEVVEELRTVPGRGLRPEGRSGADLERRRQRLDSRREATESAGHFVPFFHLIRTLHLSPFEERCLLLGFAPEIDRRYERVFAYLQDDVTRKLPTVELALALFCADADERWAALQTLHSASALRRFNILRVISPPDGPAPLLSRRLKLDDRIVHLLLGSVQIEADVGRWAGMRFEEEPDVPPELGGLLEELRSLLSSHFAQEDAGSLVIHLSGRYGAGRESLAMAACADLGVPTLWVDLRKLQGSADFDADLMRAFREALLQPAAVGVRHFQALLTAEAQGTGRMSALIDAVQTFSSLTFLIGEEPWVPVGLFEDETFISLECPEADYEARAATWHRVLEHSAESDPAGVEELASKFRFTPGQVRDAVAEARTRGVVEGSPEDPIDVEVLHAACRNQASPRLGEMARRIRPVFGWDDIVLPAKELDQLEEITAHVRQARTVMGSWGFARRFPLGRAVTALFTGGSGTGKTMAADVLAGDLRLDLYKIDLSGVVSKYIGETEKNLSWIFREARNSNAILFFDEADALFGKRSEVKDSHDRYANIEVAYLLQKMEEYDGIVILATNFKKNLDEAFVRRMRFIIDFPFPTQADRERIWRTIFPAKAPLDAAVDFDFLARKLKVTGGNIKNISLRAAYTAAKHGQHAIDMGNLIEAAKRELDKVGKLYTDEEFGSHLLPGSQHMPGNQHNGSPVGIGRESLR